MQRPRQNTLAKFRNLLAVLKHDGILANQINAADMTVKIDANAGPVEPSGHLLNMRGFTGSVIALHHHAAVVGKARKNGEGGVPVKAVIFIHIRDMISAAAERRHRQILIDAKDLSNAYLDIGRHVRIQGRWRFFSH